MLGYITYTLELDTKILTYRITDWIVECSGKECSEGNIYTTPKHGFMWSRKTLLKDRYYKQLMLCVKFIFEVMKS